MFFAVYVKKQIRMIQTGGPRFPQNCNTFRLMAGMVLPPPTAREFADISYLKEQFKLRRIRDVCTLYAEALARNSLLLKIPYLIKKK